MAKVVKLPEVVAALGAGAVLVVLALAPLAAHEWVAPVPGGARAHLQEMLLIRFRGKGVFSDANCSTLM